MSDDDGKRSMSKPGVGVPPSEQETALADAETRVLESERAEAATRVVGDDAAKPSDAPSSPDPSPPVDASGNDRGLTPGTTLFGEYEIVNVLGVGGMGEVYRARHRRLDEHRAIKVMHAELSGKKGASEFFYREAKALLAVRHPAVVHCHDLLSDESGRVYLVMEMIEGIPLSKKMSEGPLSPDEVAMLGARVSHGLSAAHRKGVIHRDLSPDNIVLPNGRVQEAKIIDFGIAKLLEEGEGTIVDGFKGKLSYASPEQLGFFGGKIDGRSDFYSLGLVLVAAARGRPMAMGTTVVEAVDARRAFTSLPDDIPVGLRSAIQPLLALEPDRRPKYVDRLFVVPGGLDPMLDENPVSSPSRETPDKAAGKSRLSLAGMAAAVGLLGLGVALYFAFADSLRPSSDPMAPAAAPMDSALESVTPPSPPESAAAVSPAPEVESIVPAAAPPTTTTPVRRKLKASERFQIIGLINNAKLALDESRLMTPAGDNAFDRYQKVLALDPTHREAKQGLREIARRYVTMADRAISGGDAEQAQTYVARARRADATYPGLSAIEDRVAAIGSENEAESGKP